MQPYPRRTAPKRKPFARTRENKKLAYMSVDPATLKQLGAQAQDVHSAQALCPPLAKDDITVGKVEDFITLVLLRLRAKIVRGTYKCH